MTIPCKECILFAICNGEQDELLCSILYEYFVEDSGLAVHLPPCDYHCVPQPDRLKEIESTFNKKIRDWELDLEGFYYHYRKDKRVIIYWEKC